jgi:putative peptide maturation system protein
MTMQPAPLLEDALEYLVGLAAGDADTTTAQRRLHELRAKHPEAKLRLLWQREEYDNSRHYDLLLVRPDRGTVSLSYCADRALPWPLRGGQRISERLLLRVNGTTMEVDQAIACLDFLWDEARLADRLVTACLVRQCLEEDPVELTDAELQHAMDAFRRAHGLLTVPATRDWMARHCLSHADLEQLVAGEAAVARLRRRETADEVRTYFDHHRPGLETARLTRLLFAERTAADRFTETVREGQDFYAAAERAAADGLLAAAVSLFEPVRRDELDPHIAEAVFTAGPGAVVGPVPSNGGHAVLRVVACDPAVFDEATADLVQRRVFDAWLERRRRSARVEWFWGNATRTAAGTRALATTGA